MDNQKILIVDDDPDLRRALKIRLQANHYDTVQASDGYAAISVEILANANKWRSSSRDKRKNWPDKPRNWPARGKPWKLRRSCFSPYWTAWGCKMILPRWQLDWMMPDLEGVDVCRRIRSNQQGPYKYVLLPTAKESKEDVVAGQEVGADDYLTKPFDVNGLHARVRAGERILELQGR